MRLVWVWPSQPQDFRGEWDLKVVSRLAPNFHLSVFQPEEIVYSDTNKSMVEDLKSRCCLPSHLMSSHLLIIQPSLPNYSLDLRTEAGRER